MQLLIWMHNHPWWGAYVIGGVVTTGARVIEFYRYGPEMVKYWREGTLRVRVWMLAKHAFDFSLSSYLWPIAAIGTLIQIARD